jgi:hypothetical protein
MKLVPLQAANVLRLRLVIQGLVDHARMEVDPRVFGSCQVGGPVKRRTHQLISFDVHATAYWTSGNTTALAFAPPNQMRCVAFL